MITITADDVLTAPPQVKAEPEANSGFNISADDVLNSGSELLSVVKSDTPVSDDIKNDISKEHSFLSKDNTVVDKAMSTGVGAGEVVLSLATGSLAEPTAGVAGIVQGLIDQIDDEDEDDRVGSIVNRIEKVSNAMTFVPKTEGGKQFMGVITQPLQKFEKFADDSGTMVGDLTRPVVGDAAPVLSAATKTGVLLFPSLLDRGISKRPTGIENISNITKAKADAKSVGVDLNKKLTDQVPELADAAKSQANNVEFLGQNLEGLVLAIEKAKVSADKHVNALYDNARSKDAYVNINSAVEYKAMVSEVIKPFIKKGLDKKTKILLAEIDEMAAVAEKSPANASIHLNRLYEFRQKINANAPSGKNKSAKAVNTIMRKQLDKILKNKFDADMISGNPEALAAWKKADKAKTEFEQTFNEANTIKRFTKNKLTPEEVSAWIFGASDVGVKTTAGNTIKQIKRAVGEDSPQMTALRNETMFKIISPLLDETPDLVGFLDNYKKLVKHNPTVIRELFPDSTNDLSKLVKIAGAQVQTSKGIIARRLESAGFEMNKTMSRLLVGHAIAKAQVKVGLVSNFIGALKKVTTRSEKRVMMAEILGYDPKAPLFKITVATNTGAITSGAKQEVDSRILNDLGLN